MKKTLITAAAIIVAGAMLPVAVARYKAFDRTVDVKGLCEREVRADRVIWPLSYKTMGDDLPDILRQAERDNAKIVDFLVNGGIPREEISVSASSISDKYAAEYGNNDRKFRYLLSNTVTVCSSRVDAVLALQARQSELMKSGIALMGDNWESRTRFSFEALNDIKPQMIQEATSNALQAAQKFAQDSDSRVGKIKSASQGTFSITDRDSNTPYIKKIRVVTNVTYYID